MSYEFQVLTQKQAEHIAYDWHYDGPYSFYDMVEDQEDLEEFLDPVQREDSTFAVMKENELIGYFSYRQMREKTLNLSLGMKPERTGQGNGTKFLSEVLTMIQSKKEPEKITLSVAIFNQRAIKLYRNVGFKDAGTFQQYTNGSAFTFLNMEYHC